VVKRIYNNNNISIELFDNVVLSSEPKINTFLKKKIYRTFARIPYFVVRNSLKKKSLIFKNEIVSGHNNSYDLKYCHRRYSIQKQTHFTVKYNIHLNGIDSS